MLEDSAEDVHLVERELKRADISFSITVVDGRNAFEVALRTLKPDVILSDHALPSFNSIEALKIFKQRQSELKLSAPFILVTGSISEEFAVQCIKAGVDDYILKDRLKRLPGCIERALEKSRIDAERGTYLDQVMANEAMLKQAEHLAHLGSWQADLVNGIHNWSDEMFRILGYNPGGVKPGLQQFLDHIYPDDATKVKENLLLAVENMPEYQCKCRVICADGQVKYLDSKFVVTRDAENRPVKLSGFLLDITDLTKYVKKIEEQNEKLRAIAWTQSHELRAPLARVMGLSNLLQTQVIANDEMPGIMGMLIGAAEELDSLVRAVVRKTEELPGEVL